MHAGACAAVFSPGAATRRRYPNNLRRAGPPLAAEEFFRRQDTTLELRLNSDFSTPLSDFGGLIGVTNPTVTSINTAPEITLTYRPTDDVTTFAAYKQAAVQGLNLNAAVNWNHARFLTLDNVPCWAGQTIAAGCTQIFNAATGLYTAQNLNGTPLIRAPSWQFNVGFTYDYDLPNDYRMVISNNNAVSSRYVTFLAVGRPNADNYQGGFMKSDLSLSLNAPRDTWELALIGKNIGDKLTLVNCSAGGQDVGNIFPGVTTGGTSSGIAGPGQEGGFVDPGREIWLRLTVKPFAGK